MYIYIWIQLVTRSITSWLYDSVVQFSRRVWFVILGPFWKYIPYNWLLTGFAPLYAIYVVLAKRSVRSVFIQRNMKLLLPEVRPRSVYAVWHKRSALDKAIYFYNRRLESDIKACARRIEECAEQARADGSPVILAPLHMVSETVALGICALVAPSKIWIVAARETGILKPDQLRRFRDFGVDIVWLDPLTLKSGELIQALSALKRGKGNFLIFPDSLPEITTRIFRKTMSTENYILFDRKAQLHSGLAKMAHMVGAKVLFFSLATRAERIVIEMIKVVPCEEISVELPAFIEAALRNTPQSWMLWHSPSSFFFNSTNPMHDE